MKSDDSITCPVCGGSVAVGEDCYTCLLALALPDSQEEAGGVGLEDGLEHGVEHGVDDGQPGMMSRLGEYELLERLGRGGMGIVFRAQQASLNREVALKVITSGALAAPDVIERFRAEAESSAGMDHPNIVTVHEVGECDGQHYLSMRLVEGGTLGDRIEEFRAGVNRSEKRMRLRRAIALVGKVARAAAYAHQRGILHRDIKPGNILLDQEGEPFLSDFGLAKVLEDQGDMTMTLAVLGTPAYMAPEQAEGKSRGLTTAVDVYALGVVLYELMTGEIPFTGETTMALLRDVVDRTPKRPSIANPDIDQDLDTICLKCLAKEPERRYESALKLAEDLDRWLEGRPIEARPAGTMERLTKWVRRRPVAAALIGVSILSLITIGVGGALFNFRLQSANEEIAQRAAAQRESLIRITEETGMRYFEEGDYHGALPWFVSSLRLEADDKERQDLHRRRIGIALRSSPRLIRTWRHEQSAQESYFSADGSRLVVFSDEGDSVQIIDTVTGEKVLPPVPHEGGAATIALSDDNKRIATTGPSGTVRIRSASNGEAIGALLKHDEAVIMTSFTPDGQKCVSVTRGGEVAVWDASSGENLSRTTVPIRAESAALDNQGLRLALAGPNPASFDGRMMVQILDLKTGAVVVGGHKVEPGRSAASHLKRLGGRIRSLDFSSDGKLLLACTDQDFRLLRSESGDPATDVVSHAARDKKSGSLLSELMFAEQRRLIATGVSPDKPVLATCFDDGTVKVRDISSGAALFAPLEHRHMARDVEFSPDGRHLLTCGDDRTAVIWSARTGRRVGPPLRHLEGILSAHFSPDGTMVLTTSRSETRIWSLVTDLRVGPVIAMKGGRRMDFAEEDRELITLGSANELRRWDLETGRETGTVAGIQRLRLPANALMRPKPPNADPTGERELVIEGQVVLIRDRGSKAGQTRALEHRGNISFARFSGDGRWVLTGSEDGTGRVWDAGTGNPLTPPLAGDSAVSHGILSRNGDRVAMLTDGVWISAWNLSPDPRPLHQLADMAALLSGQRSDGSAGISLLDQKNAPDPTLLESRTFPSPRQRNAWAWNSALEVALSDGLPAANAVLSLSATAAEANLLKGQFAMSRFNLILAKLLLEKDLEENPDDSFVKGLLGAVYRDTPFIGKDLAEKLYQEALLAEPTRSSYWEGLGRVQLDLKKMEEAEESLGESLEIDPGNASAMDALGDCLAAQGRWDEALDQFRKVAAAKRKVLVRDGGTHYSLPIPSRDPKTPAEAIDLTDYYSRAPASFPGFEELPDKKISAIPGGLLELGGVTLDARGAIVVSSEQNLRRGVPIARDVKGIPVRKKCDRIHFLHTVRKEIPEGWIVDLLFTYADGTTVSRKLTYGHHARDCYHGSSEPLLDLNSHMVWNADRESEDGNPRVYLTTIENPDPDQELVMIHVASSRNDATWILLAVTVD